MESSEYEVMYHFEEEYWWYVGLHDLILSAIPDRRDRISILDAGCGTGKLLAMIGNRGAVGVELSADAFPYLARRGVTEAARASIERIPFPSESFDVVVSADVLCCLRSPRDSRGFRELGRVLKSGGTLLLNLPAFESLRGRHDEAVHVRTRYTSAMLRERLRDAGLTVKTLTYRNAALLPAIAVARALSRVRNSRSKPRSDLRRLPRAINSILTRLLLLENRLIRSGYKLPLGLSIFCEASKS